MSERDSDGELDLRTVSSRQLPGLLQELLCEAEDIEELASARLREARAVEAEIRRRHEIATLRQKRIRTGDRSDHSEEAMSDDRDRD